MPVNTGARGQGGWRWRVQDGRLIESVKVPVILQADWIAVALLFYNMVRIDIATSLAPVNSSPVYRAQTRGDAALLAKIGDSLTAWFECAIVVDDYVAAR